MNLETIYVKTEKGKAELATRRDLPTALRHALILVDGHSKLKDLLKKGEGMPHFADSLEMLEQMRLLAPAGASAASPPPPTPAQPQAPTASEGSTVKAQLVVLATNLLGAQATKTLKKIEESAATKESLIMMIEGCSKVIRLTIDEKKAEEFAIAAKRIVSNSL